MALIHTDQTDEEKLADLGVINSPELEPLPVENTEEVKNEVVDSDEPELVLTKTTKHTLQQYGVQNITPFYSNKIVDMMSNYGIFLTHNAKYLEYGAGRGLLSFYLHERIDESLKSESNKNVKQLLLLILNRIHKNNQSSI